MLTVSEAAKELGIKEGTVRLWCANRKIGYVKLGRAVRIPRTEIERLIEQGFVPARTSRNS